MSKKSEIFGYLDEHPKATDGGVIKALGPIKKSTVHTAAWKWRKAHSMDALTRPGVLVVSPMLRNGALKPGWEDILQAIPDVPTLGTLLVEGFMARLEVKDQLIVSLRADLKKMMSEHNESLAKTRVGTLTVDQVKGKLIPKE